MACMCVCVSVSLLACLAGYGDPYMPASMSGGRSVPSLASLLGLLLPFLTRSLVRSLVCWFRTATTSDELPSFVLLLLCILCVDKVTVAVLCVRVASWI
jgi:hypothetical protein